jgi:hypothetical protein
MLLLVDAASAQEDREARSFIDRIAAPVFKCAWFTATYESVSVKSLTPVTGGFDATLRMSGKSGLNDGPLRLDIVFMLRDGRLHDVRVIEHNAVIPPFTTCKAIGSMIASLAESYAQSASSSSPRPLPSSFVLQVANDCHLPIKVWLRYRAASGEWFTNGPWTLDPSYRNHLLEGAAGSAPLTVTSRIVDSYAEPDMPDPPIVWSGQTKVSFKGEVLPMRTDTLTGDTPGSLILSRHCDIVPRLGAVTETARQYQYNGQTYTQGVRVLEVLTGQLAERLGLRPGDVIYKINNQVIENRDALVRTMVRFASEPMTLHFIRGSANLNVTLPATGR